METVWSFETKRFRVTLELEYYEPGAYQYDGDDPDGEIQAKLNRNELMAFDSRVVVYLDGQAIGEDSLGGSVYLANHIEPFWTGHRSADPMNRNCSIMRANHPSGPAVSICHYFPDMVSMAIAEARSTLCGAPKMRCAA